MTWEEHREKEGSGGGQGLVGKGQLSLAGRNRALQRLGNSRIPSRICTISTLISSSYFLVSFH